jgi:hypothetical protein
MCLDHGQSLHSKYSRSITVIFVDRKDGFFKKFSGKGVLRTPLWGYRCLGMTKITLQLLGDHPAQGGSRLLQVPAYPEA